MQKVTEQDVNTIIDLTLRMQSIKYVPTRKAEFTNAVKELSDSAKWLLTFCCWHSLFNAKYKGISEDRLLGTYPAEVNKATFLGFLKYLRKHEDVNLTPSRELPTLKFLSSCDKPHFEFYKSLMLNTWIAPFPIIEVQSLLDLDSITKERVYGEIEYLKTDFSGLSYPISVRPIPRCSMQPFILVREAYYSSLLVCGIEGYKTVTKPTWIDEEIALSTTPRFVLTGFISKDTLYPTDYFDNRDELHEYLLDRDITPYEERIQKLNAFLNRSLTVNMLGTNHQIAHTAEELDSLLQATLRGYGTGDLLITDEDSGKSTAAHRVKCDLARGTIEDIWVEEGKALGFSVWFNGELINCAYEFNLQEQAILAARDTVKGKVFLFHIVGLPDFRRIGSEVVWKQRRWKAKRLRGSDKWIEKCILCGDTKIRHSNNGMCVSCENSLATKLAGNGPDVWITPSKYMAKKREANSWSNALLNAAQFRYKGLLLVADEEGKWKFTTEE